MTVLARAGAQKRDLAQWLGPLRGAVPWLVEAALADEVAFVIAGCAFEGMAPLKPFSQLMDRGIRQRLEQQYRAMPMPTRAVEALRARLLPWQAAQ